jgi:hypothetical protein
MKAGIPLHQIEEELDWADANREFQGLTMVADGYEFRDTVLRLADGDETSEYVLRASNDHTGFSRDRSMSLPA